MRYDNGETVNAKTCHPLRFVVEMPPMSHAVELHLRIRVAPQNRDALIKFLTRAIPFYERPGGIRVRLLQQREDPCAFIEVIEYLDCDSYERDQERVRSDPAMKAWLDEWRTLLDGPVGIETYDLREVELVNVVDPDREGGAS